MSKEKSTTPTPEFEFADEDSFGAPRTVLAALPLKPYAVQYVDGRGEKQVKVCFVLESDPPLVYILDRSVNGSSIVSNAKRWFVDEVAKQIGYQKAVEEGAAMGVEQL